MFRKDPKCGKCGKEIKGDEVVYENKLSYPTEIKAYLKNEGRFICEACFDKKI